MQMTKNNDPLTAVLRNGGLKCKLEALCPDVNRDSVLVVPTCRDAPKPANAPSAKTLTQLSTMHINIFLFTILLLQFPAWRKIIWLFVLLRGNCPVH